MYFFSVYILVCCGFILSGIHRSMRRICLDSFLFLGYSVFHHGGVAKLVIASACQAEDRIWYGAFFSGSSAGGSALGSGLRGRGFESRLPDFYM